MIIMKIEYTIPGSLLEFALFIKFIISHKQRQIEHMFIWLFFIIFRCTISSRSGSRQVTKHPVYIHHFSLHTRVPAVPFVILINISLLQRKNLFQHVRNRWCSRPMEHSRSCGSIGWKQILFSRAKSWRSQLPSPSPSSPSRKTILSCRDKSRRY